MALYWAQGKTNIVADALSRAPVWPAPETSDILACSPRVAMARMPKDESVAELATKATEDPNYKAIKACKRPQNLQGDHPVQSVSASWSDLSLQANMSGLIFYMGHIWVLEAAKADLKEKLHVLHVGEAKTLALARSLYFLPWMVKELRKIVWACP